MFNFEWSNADAVLRPLRPHHELLAELADDGRPAVPRGRRARRSSRSSATSCRPRSSPSPPARPPVQKPERTDRAALRQASKLLDEAGWTVGPGGLPQERQGRDADASSSSTTTPPSSGSSTPSSRTCARIGIDASYPADRPRRRCRSAQKHFDYDIIPAARAMSLSPSVELARALRLDERRRPAARSTTPASPTRWSTR